MVLFGASARKGFFRRCNWVVSCVLLSSQQASWLARRRPAEAPGRPACRMAELRRRRAGQLARQPAGRPASQPAGWLMAMATAMAMAIQNSSAIQRRQRARPSGPGNVRVDAAMQCSNAATLLLYYYILVYRYILQYSLDYYVIILVY